MTAIEFKTAIKEIKENLRGLTIQFVTKHSVRPYNNLREFGEAILNEESFGHDFFVNRIWTVEGSKNVSTISQLKELFKTEKITGVSFEAYYQPKNLSESMRYGYTYND
jgi:hypothetical protein